MIIYETAYHLNHDNSIQTTNLEFEWAKYQTHWSGYLRVRDDHGKPVFTGPWCIARWTKPIVNLIKLDKHVLSYRLNTRPNGDGDMIAEGYADSIEEVQMATHAAMVSHMMEIHRMGEAKEVFRNMLAEIKQLRGQLSGIKESLDWKSKLERNNFG